MPKLAGAACSELVQVQVGASCPASPHQLPAHRPRGQETPVFTPTAPPKCRGCSRSCHRLMGLLAGSCPSPSSRAEPRPGAWAGGGGAAGHARGRSEPGCGRRRPPEAGWSPAEAPAGDQSAVTPHPRAAPTRPRAGCPPAPTLSPRASGFPRAGGVICRGCPFGRMVIPVRKVQGTLLAATGVVWCSLCCDTSRHQFRTHKHPGTAKSGGTTKS